jgi:hypothetical protein
MPGLLETLLIAAKEEIRDTNKDSFEQRTLCIGGLANMCAGHELCRSIQSHGNYYHSCSDTSISTHHCQCE